MKKVTIKLETINDVKNFVSAVTTFESKAHYHLRHKLWDSALRYSSVNI